MREHTHSSFSVMSFAEPAGAGLLALAASLGTVAAAEVPVRFIEGALHTTGPVWRIQLTSPRWLD